ncbi:MAG: RNA polymerase sigma factor [Planctomycetota bacterium]|jgi:RNA polymerase sigma-70 factor (ECF subfamily)
MANTDLGDRRRWVLSAVEEHEGRLTRFAARLVGSLDAARDVVQHVFLKLCERSPEGLEHRLDQWLFTVCRNRAVDLLRARHQTASLASADDPPEAKSADPAAIAEERDLVDRLNRLVDDLPPAQREAVLLWSEGFNYREMAHITGCGEGNVRVLVHRALKTLRGHPVVRQLVADPGGKNRLPPQRSTERV